jgi:hypothetical protein
MGADGWSAGDVNVASLVSYDGISKSPSNSCNSKERTLETSGRSMHCGPQPFRQEPLAKPSKKSSSTLRPMRCLR